MSELDTFAPVVQRDFLREVPAIEQALLAGPGAWVVEQARSFARAMPIPPRATWFIEESYFRLPGQVRCFHYSPDPPLGADTAADPRRGVIAIKGAEPLANDHAQLLRDLQKSLYVESGFVDQRRQAERFVLLEHKVPGCLALAEAENEAAKAAEFQRRHLEVYGELAHVPVPLFITRHSDEVSERVLTSLRKQLSSVSYHRIADSVRHGLGCYVYHYPFVPVRVDALPEQSTVHHRQALLRSFDPERIVRRWVRGFVRMLYLGYLPATLGSIMLGNCCREQNAVLDGGFVDLDSITRLEEIPDDAYFCDDLQYSVLSLSRTVFSYLFKLGRGTAAPNYGNEQTDRFVRHVMREAIESEARPDVSLDPRIVRYFEEEMSFATLVERVTRYYPSPTAEEQSVASFPGDRVRSSIVRSLIALQTSSPR